MTSVWQVLDLLGHLVTFLIWNFKLSLLELDQEVGTFHWNLPTAGWFHIWFWF
jgi:hypothetical protein